jgi:GxxExxY protein
MIPLGEWLSWKQRRKDMKETKDMKKGGRAFSPLSHLVIGRAIDVHRDLGPGLLESSYCRCLCQELRLARVPFKMEAPIAIEYKGLRIECAYRIDVFVNREIVVEVKSVEALKSVHEAQVLTYMKLSGARGGILINFNSHRLTDGLRTFIL